MEDNKFKKPIVLVVEDDEMSDLLITIIIEEKGYEVLHAKSGIEAIEVCKSHPEIQLILMDIKMPKMDGYEATKKIRGFNKEVIIIMQTAYAMAGDKEKALDVGCNEYITKPIVIELLLELLEKYIGNENK